MNQGLLLVSFVIDVTSVYVSIAAFPVELFPTRTSRSAVRVNRSGNTYLSAGLVPDLAT